MAERSADAAKELWEQVFARLAGTDDAAIVRPESDDGDHQQKFAAALKEAGWPDDVIAQRVAIHRQQTDSAPVTSPGVYRHTEAIFAQLCDDVEEAMTRLGISTHTKVARGIEPRAWVYAAKINVVMTEESIVTVSAFMFRFCGLVARAFTRTLHLNPYSWEKPTFTVADGRALLREAPELFRYWLRIYMSFAATGTHLMVPYKPAAMHEVVLFEQIARAMEIFVVAHEYGHHHFAHGKSIEGDPHMEEFEADKFAIRIGRAVKPVPPMFENPYLMSGAGGVIMLEALHTLRAVRVLMGNAPAEGADTHPPLDERLRRFENIALLEPREFERLQSFRAVSRKIMHAVHAMVLETIGEVPRTELNKMAALGAGE